MKYKIFLYHFDKKARNELTDGGNLEEPVAAGLLSHLVDLVVGKLFGQGDRDLGARRDVCRLAVDAIIHETAKGIQDLCDEHKLGRVKLGDLGV